MEHENNPSPEPQESRERRPLALDEFVGKWRAAAAIGPRTQSSFEVENLEELPPADVEAARELFTALVTSEDEELRTLAAGYVDCLYYIDQDAGLQLWHTLLQDPSHEVAGRAGSSLETNADDGKLAPEQWAWLSQAYELGQVMRGPEPKIDPAEVKADWQRFQDALRREAEYLGIDMEEEKSRAEREIWRRAEEEIRYLFDDLEEDGSDI